MPEKPLSRGFSRLAGLLLSGRPEKSQNWHKITGTKEEFEPQ